MNGAASCHIEPTQVGRMLLRSLYLPDYASRRLSAAWRVAEGCAGRDLGLPIRRLIAVRA